MFTFKATQWVPRFILRDKNGYALAKAIEAAMQVMNDTVETGVRWVTDYDAMPEWRLDEVAWETGIFYDYSADTEAKRAAVKSGISIYRLLGTKAGVIQALSTIYESCDIEEWFEYDGSPFHFNLQIDITNDETSAVRQAKLLRYLEFCKPARSILDNVEYYINKEELAALNLYAGVGMQAAKTVGVGCETPTLEDIAYLTDENDVILKDEIGAWLAVNEEE